MASAEIKPEKVTKPFQLLATWLAGLVILEGILTYGSVKILALGNQTLSTIYCISSIVIIPVFLIFIFLLQTRYRPEMQEDKYYFEWLTRKYGKELIKGDIIYYNLKNKKIRK